MDVDLSDPDVGDCHPLRSSAGSGTERVIVTGMRRALSPAGVERQIAVVKPSDAPGDATAA